MTSLYCILAREADRGVIFRRGPSKQVCLIGWDLKAHTFTPGQWFKGRIYERKADLTPDGTKMVYPAAKFHGPIPDWVAVSKPPFLTALVLWQTSGAWNLLSTFESDTHLALGGFAHDSMDPAEGFAVPQQIQVTCRDWPGYFDIMPDHDRMLRDGWRVHAGSTVYEPYANRQAPITYRHPLPAQAHLQLKARSEQEAFYAVCDDLGTVINLNADWATVRGQDLFYSQGGKLLRTRVAQTGGRLECDPPVELADFTAMRFQPAVAPDWARTW